MKGTLSGSARLAAVAALIVGGASAHSVVTMDFSIVLTGFTPGGPAPWATLTIEDAGADTVQMTLDHHATGAPGQFLSKLFMNLNSFPNDLTFSTASPLVAGHTFANDGINLVGGPYDFLVDFVIAPPPSRFLPGDSAVWTVSGTGIDENSFSVNSPGGVLALLHIQGIGPGGEESGHVTVVPEPATLLAIGFGIAALAARRRKSA